MVAMVIIVAKVMMVMVNIVVMVVGTGQDRTLSGQDRTGQDRTKLIFKPDFPGGWQLSQFLRCFFHLVCLVRDKAQVDRVMRKTATGPLWFWMATPTDVQGKPILRKQKIYMENYL